MSRLEYVKGKNQLPAESARKLMQAHLLEIWETEAIERLYGTDTDNEIELSNVRTILRKIDSCTDFDEMMNMYWEFALDGTRDFDMFRDLLWLFIQKPEAKE